MWPQRQTSQRAQSVTHVHRQSRVARAAAGQSGAAEKPEWLRRVAGVQWLDHDCLLQSLRLTTDELQFARVFDGCQLRSIYRDLEEDAVDDPDKAKLLEGANGDPEVVQDRVRTFVANPDAVLTLT